MGLKVYAFQLMNKIYVYTQYSMTQAMVAEVGSTLGCENGPTLK